VRASSGEAPMWHGIHNIAVLVGKRDDAWSKKVDAWAERMMHGRKRQHANTRRGGNKGDYDTEAIESRYINSTLGEGVLSIICVMSGERKKISHASSSKKIAGVGAVVHAEKRSRAAWVARSVDVRELTTAGTHTRP